MMVLLFLFFYIYFALFFPVDFIFFRVYFFLIYIILMNDKSEWRARILNGCSD